MVAKRLKSGVVGYYWNAPTWARRNGCPVAGEALGMDYALAKQRCDEVLNPQFDAWRTHGELAAGPSFAQLFRLDGRNLQDASEVQEEASQDP